MIEIMALCLNVGRGTVMNDSARTKAAFAFARRFDDAAVNAESDGRSKYDQC
jgi:hypothetical protein